MVCLLSRLNPTPAFPSYTGPYKVGTIDVEIPASDLTSPSPAPDAAISTVHFRVFYPCETPTTHERPVRWIPQPQREYLGAYARFLGAGSMFAEVFSYFPQLLYYINIPALRNARLLAPVTTSKRWPVMVFSHGLGGSRNAYSHLLGSLSSHGVVIIAPDHRDGSSPIQFIRETSGSKRRRVDYQSFPHKPSQEAEAGRNKQLQIRLWELGMIHEAILKMDTDGDSINNLCAKGGSLSKHDRMSTIAMFRDQLDVHRPGSISWVGHSFGATTMVQFVKSTFWRPSSAPHQGEPYLRDYEPLFTPTEDSQIVRQITPSSPISLLDLWCLPLRGQTTRWLWDKPMPCHCPSGPGGKALLAVLSEAFFKWQGNLKYSKRVLSENPASNSYKQSKPGPRFFYPVASAHLSQSDFGVLFPWVTKKVFKAENPERTLRLNVRAILQVMREVGQEVADTSKIDIEEGGVTGETEVPVNGVDGWQDWKILATDGRVKGWVSVSTNVNDLGDSTKGIADPKATPTEAVMEGEVRDGDHRRQNI